MALGMDIAGCSLPAHRGPGRVFERHPETSLRLRTDSWGIALAYPLWYSGFTKPRRREPAFVSAAFPDLSPNIAGERLVLVQNLAFNNRGVRYRSPTC